MITTSPATKSLILPGLDGSPDPHWQHGWATTDPTALIVDQQDWSRPSAEAWKLDLAWAILQHPGCCLVGHSPGAILAARFLTRWALLTVAAAFLLAPANPDHSHRLAFFAGIPDRSCALPATSVVNRNDPWTSLAQSCAL